MKNVEKLDFVPLGGYGTCRKPFACEHAVVIIAPHPDDDVIGMGGAMRLFADEGKKVFSVYVTSGSSASACSGNAAGVRRSEALSALRVVRAAGAFFLNQHSSELDGKARSAALRQLRAIIALLKPAAVYLPSPFEFHPTHRRVTRLVLEALKQKPPRRISVWGYSVWGGIYGLPGTKVLDISKFLAAKKRAIRKHASQTAGKPFELGILGRNAYEGIFLQTHGRRFMRGAETFIDVRRLQTSKAARSIIRAIAARRSYSV